MRKLTVIILSLLVSIQSFAQDIFSYPEVMEDEIIIHHTGFTVSYNAEAMIPNWVAYELHASDMEGNAVRAGRFSPDPSQELAGYPLVEHWQYTNSGWVRGHMVPAGDLKYSQAAMDCSFYTTNVCPMDMAFNNGIWKRLEEKVRKLAVQYGCVQIVTGPVIGTNKNGKVGQSDILVPDAYFKAILITVNGSYKALGFYLTNEPAPSGGKMRDFALTVRDLESLIGRRLFVKLNPRVAREVKGELPLKEFGLY